MSHKRLLSVVIAAFMIVGLQAATLNPVAANTHEGPQDHPYAADEFYDRWARVDLPVAEGVVDRTYIWGPGPFTEGLMEVYLDSPGDERLVQYFDKSRMEINHPDQPEDNLWYVTNGLLVVEMVEGKYQIGDHEFDESPEPAEIPIAGDPDSPYGPTYADVNQFNLQDQPAQEVGETIIDSINEAGEITADEQYAQYDVMAAELVEETGHVVASPFWEFMTAEGVIWNGEEYVTAELFPNPYYAVGYPITNAYWSEFEVAGTVRDVLWQCFERRCLTYTPGNPEGFVVEAGNVGQHYYRWRYLTDDVETETVEIFLVATETGGPIGCGDTLQPVEVEIQATDDPAETVERALSELFAINEQMYGESGLYNALYQSNLMVQSVAVQNGQATVEITGDVMIGGVCDEPRFVEQIRQTVLGIEGIESAMITVNGTPLSELFGGDGDGETETVQNFFVLLEDAGEMGMLIGCNDSLVGVDVQIQATDDTATQIERALSNLLGIDERMYQDQYYNALYQSNLTVADVQFANGEATVNLTGDIAIGGVCDEPRFTEQIRQTVLDIEGVEAATITVNGTPLDELFGGRGETMTVQNFFVLREDAGENGMPIGCDDSLVGIDVEIMARSGDTAMMIERALSELLNTDEEIVQDEYYNSLYQSDLSVTNVNFVQGLANVYLSGDVAVGGTCDEPRFIEQIRQTVLQFDDVQMANIWVNGEYLTGYFSPEDLVGGLLAAFSVEGEVFQVWATEESTIQQILALQAGESNANIPNGTILRGPGIAEYNLPWSWHLENVEMAEVTIEVCDGRPSYVEDNLDEFVDTIGQYCPWNAELIYVEDRRDAGQ